jgi:superfamily I DNA and/or RNA helicase
MPDQDVVVLIERILKELKELPPEVAWRQLLANADVVFCTLASAGGLVFKNTTRVDDLIVDEAAAATEPELCIPFHLMPNRLMIVGDPLQLPATVLSRKATTLGLTKSLHERLMFDCQFDHVMLDVQYRMHPEISSFPSLRFYNNQIANGANVTARNDTTHCKLLDQRPYIFLHVAGMEEQALGGSYRNMAEAKVVLELMTQLESMSGGNSNWFSANRIRIITFYQAQVQLLKRTLQGRPWGHKIVVATVDSSQGTEADIVVVSFVRGRKDSDNDKVSRHTAGFLTDDRRMNVALTRARHQLICVGNVRTVGCVEGTLKLLTENAHSRQVLQSYPSPQTSANVVGSQLDMFYGREQQQPAAKKTRY